ncbi:MAG: shikimate dehydrogenase [Clostridia bacterium]|nr:shikimate dehydrogenase [Clostridia bacterium]
MQYGLIGQPLGHSYSPELHNQIAAYKYELQELKPEELEAFLQKRQFRGINVTIPYKQAVIPFLDELSPMAQKIGAVNTIVNCQGKLCGYNTDLAGMAALARRIGLSFRGKKVLILGSGGTSRTAWALAEAGAARQFFRVSRNGREGTISYTEARSRHQDTQLILNTTPAGMAPDWEGQPLDLTEFPALEGVLEVIYHPLRSNLVLAALQRQLPAEGGLYMLVAQAVYASALFLGQKVRESLIEQVYQRLLAEKQNLVLIGMPSAGKSTMGRELARRLARPFVDTDQKLAELTGQSPAAYLTEKGEAAFRKLESQVIQEWAAQSGQVIATGGGAVLNPANVRRLRQNGRLIFLDRSPEKLLVTADRPLSASRENLLRLYQERFALYQAAADFRIDGNGSREEVLALIEEALAKCNF